jgi:hypothetical protein
LLFLVPTTFAGEVDNTRSSGVIDTYIFSRSVPQRMKIGKSYPINFRFKNVGEKAATFRVVLNIHKGHFYTKDDTTIFFDVDKDATEGVIFYLTPIKQYRGEIDFVGELYMLKSGSEKRFVLVDRFADQVHGIDKNFYDIELILILLGLILMMTYLIIRFV